MAIGGVMVSVLALSAVDREFESRSYQTKDYKIGCCCFSAKQSVLRRKSKNWLPLNHDNVSEWGDMSVRGQQSLTLSNWPSVFRLNEWNVKVYERWRRRTRGSDNTSHDRWCQVSWKYIYLRKCLLRVSWISHGTLKLKRLEIQLNVFLASKPEL